MTTPPTGSAPDSKPDPIKSSPNVPSPKPLESSDSKDAILLNSPFAKMFRGTGAEPTVQEMRAIINGILQQQIDTIKQQDARWKEAMKKLKDAIEGNDE